MSSACRRALFLLTMVAAISAILAPGAAASEPLGKYIVVFKDSVEHPGNLAHVQVDSRDGDMNAYFHQVGGYAATLSKADINRLRRDPRVKYISVDQQMSIQEVKLDDQNDVGGSELSEATIPTGIQRSYASSNKTLKIDGVDNVRANVDVAVIDSGIDFEHPDLSVVARTDCTGGTCVDNSGLDGSTHGTHVAGTIGAIDNGYGVTGVAPGARLWAVRVLDNGGFGSTSNIIKGVEWVTAHAADIEVANMSLGCECSQPALDTAINKSIEAGVVYVVAAGNSAKDAVYFSPASNPNVITVSALADYDGLPGGKSAFTCKNYGPDDTRATFSNIGNFIEIAAPGVCILSTEPGNKYGLKSGTSMASPMSRVLQRSWRLRRTQTPKPMWNRSGARSSHRETTNGRATHKSRCWT